jgi:hypothetical protein
MLLSKYFEANQGLLQADPDTSILTTPVLYYNPETVNPERKTCHFHDGRLETENGKLGAAPPPGPISFVSVRFRVYSFRFSKKSEMLFNSARE